MRSEASERIFIAAPKTAPTGEWSRAQGKVKRSAAFSLRVRFQEIPETCVLVPASIKRD